MFTRIIYGDSTAFFTIAAFGVATSIFITISWRALRMKRPQIEHYESLPFLTATPAAGGEDHAGSGQHSTSEDEPQLRT